MDLRLDEVLADLGSLPTYQKCMRSLLCVNALLSVSWLLNLSFFYPERRDNSSLPITGYGSPFLITKSDDYIPSESLPLVSGPPSNLLSTQQSDLLKI